MEISLLIIWSSTVKYWINFTWFDTLSGGAVSVNVRVLYGQTVITILMSHKQSLDHMVEILLKYMTL